MKSDRYYLRSIWNYISNLVKAIVSGMPREQVTYKPGHKTTIHRPKENFRPDAEKHYHRPISKPPVEKQTLLKENKKAKTVH